MFHILCSHTALREVRYIGRKHKEFDVYMQCIAHGLNKVIVYEIFVFY